MKTLGDQALLKQLSCLQEAQYEPAQGYQVEDNEGR